VPLKQDYENVKGKMKNVQRMISVTDEDTQQF